MVNPAEYDVQTAINESACMITDYSSVLFDFAYLGKPVIFYQFDEKKFREAQYAEGYFSYKNTILGEWTESAEGVIKILKEKVKNFATPDRERVKKCFEFVDNKNNERIFEVIKNANKNS